MRYGKKLTDKQIKEIRDRYKKGKGVKQAALAREYGVSQGHISQIVTGRQYAQPVSDDLKKTIRKQHKSGRKYPDIAKEHKLPWGVVKEICDE